MGELRHISYALMDYLADLRDDAREEEEAVLRAETEQLVGGEIQPSLDDMPSSPLSKPNFPEAA